MLFIYFRWGGGRERKREQAWVWGGGEGDADSLLSREQAVVLDLRTLDHDLSKRQTLTLTDWASQEAQQTLQFESKFFKNRDYTQITSP